MSSHPTFVKYIERTRDFPLGNPCGKPYDREMQHRIIGSALDLIESATQARTTVQTPFIWDEDESWKERYMHVDAEQAEKLKKL